MIIGIDFRQAIGKKTGKGVYCLNMVKELIKLRPDLGFILYTDQQSQLFQEYKNVQIISCATKGVLWHFKIWRRLKKDKIDLFWAPTSFIIPFFLGKKLPFIITVHDLVAFLFPTWHNHKAVLIEKFTLKRAVKYAKNILVVSEHTGQDLQRFFQVPEEKLVLTYNGFSSESKYHIPNTICQIPYTKYILNIGTLEPRKNQIRLIAAFDQIKDQFPDFKLLIGGGKGWGYETIYLAVEKRKLGDRVKFLGYVPEDHLPKLYQNATCFAFPSIYEGFGIPVLDAMSYGCPVITAKNSSLPEVAGEAAIYVQADDTNAIAEALQKVLKEKDLRKELIEKGLKQASKFTWNSSAENLSRVL